MGPLIGSIRAVSSIAACQLKANLNKWFCQPLHPTLDNGQSIVCYICY